MISDELLEEHFVCNLEACKGACCIEGDRGAPLEPEELKPITENLSTILSYLPEAQSDEIRKAGFYETDTDGELVTRCMPDGRCVFATEHDGILACGMEEAFRDEKSDFPKPVSCHLYPVRVRQYKELTAVNYHQWHICSPACVLGEKLGVPVYRFVEQALIRKFGQDWYDALKEAADYLDAPNSDEP